MLFCAAYLDFFVRKAIFLIFFMGKFLLTVSKVVTLLL